MKFYIATTPSDILSTSDLTPDFGQFLLSVCTNDCLSAVVTRHDDMVYCNYACAFLHKRFEFDYLETTVESCGLRSWESEDSSDNLISSMTGETDRCFAEFISLRDQRTRNCNLVVNDVINSCPSNKNNDTISRLMTSLCPSYR